MQTLLDAAQLSRAERLNETGGGAVPMLRRRTRPTGGRSTD